MLILADINHYCHAFTKVMEHSRRVTRDNRLDDEKKKLRKLKKLKKKAEAKNRKRKRKKKRKKKHKRTKHEKKTYRRRHDSSSSSSSSTTDADTDEKKASRHVLTSDHEVGSESSNEKTNKLQLHSSNPTSVAVGPLKGSAEWFQTLTTRENCAKRVGTVHVKKKVRIYVRPSKIWHCSNNRRQMNLTAQPCFVYLFVC